MNLKPLWQQLLAWSLGIVLTIAFTLVSWGIGEPGTWSSLLMPAPGYAASLATTETATSPANQSAVEIFRAAYENRYTWDEAFPGYEAEAIVRKDRDSFQGRVVLLPDYRVGIQDIDNSEIQQAVVAQLQMSATHLGRLAFEELHGENQFEQLETDKSGAVKIREQGDETNASYQIKQQQITQVNRTLNELAVEVNTIDAMQTPEGYLANHFQVIFRNAENGKILEQDDVRDTYSKVGNYYILTKRDIRTGQEDNPASKLLADMSVQFKNIQLLQPGDEEG